MNIADYESVVRYIDEHIQLAVNALKPGCWILQDEDGVLKDLTEARYCFPTKKAAIEEFGSRCMDARRVPKVERLKTGHYLYIVKDFDTGHDKDPINVIKLTKDNLVFYQEKLRNDLEFIRDEEILPMYSNPLLDDDALEKAIKQSVSLEIYNPEESEIKRK